jgi:RNA polymerase sigma factor (sigma-70 family)
MQTLENIYHNYSNKIYNFAYRLTGSKEDAQDITQETFIQAFKAIEKFKGNSQVYSWLYRIAKNNCLRFIQKKKKNSFSSFQKLAVEVGSPVLEDISESEKSIYISQVKEGCLSGLIRCLSIQQRLAFILNILLDLPIDHVASILEKSENATRILVHRSRQNIKDYLCRNCSIYDSQNTCQCDNLINFSLKQGWIFPDSEINLNLNQAEKEIKNLKKVISLYKSLQEENIPESYSIQIKHLLTNKNEFLIFNDKKVK